METQRSIAPIAAHSLGYIGGGGLHQIIGSQVRHTNKNWTQSDLRFYENVGSYRFKINEKGGQLDRKSRRKLIQNAYNLLNNTFW